jgi:hypothetical protein
LSYWEPRIAPRQKGRKIQLSDPTTERKKTPVERKNTAIRPHGKKEKKTPIITAKGVSSF